MFDCNYFWRAVSISSDGSVEPCCHFMPSLHTSSKINWKSYVDNKTLKDYKIQNQQFLQDMRQTVLDGGTPKGCAPCVVHEASGRQSPRLKGFAEGRRQVPENEKTSIIPVEYIEHMDLFLSNVCNFMCVMCNEDFSHLIAKEKLKNKAITTWGDNEEHILKFMRKAKNLKKITIAGGEPFYNVKYLHTILETVLPIAHNIEILITTNGSNKITLETAQLMNKFKSVSLSISIDATEKYGEIQRWKSNWNELKENVTHMRTMFDENKVEMELNTTITAITVPNLPNLLEWVDGNPAITWINPVFVVYPQMLQCNILKSEALNKISSQLKEMYKRKKFKKLDKRIIDMITVGLDNMESTGKYRQQFDAYFESLKKSRGLDIYKALPELKNMLV